jgi:hypothetical protein
MNLVAALTSALMIAETFAKYTKTTIDDTLVAVGKAILNSPALIELLQKLVNNPTILATTGEERTVAIRSFASANAPAEAKFELPWDKILEYLPVIVRLILSFTGKR